MIPRAEFDAYNRAVAAIARRASSSVERGVLAWARSNPDAGAAELREAAKGVMAGAVQVHDEAAASLAAEWYDARAAGHGYKLPAAVTSTVYAPESADAVARYQARLIAAGDLAGFARACGEFAANDAMRSLNETILANAARDGRRGVRFARVPTGAETCPFCLMLASRGAVYASRERAGEFRHFHRGCDCKVVPGFGGDPDEELVEGVSPARMREAMSRIEDETGLTFGRGSDSARLGRSLGLRSAQWLETGAAEAHSIEEGARPSPKEKGTAARLEARGITVRFRRTRSRESKHTSDVLINGAAWEFKQPVGSGRNNVNNQFNAAAKQSDRLVIDASTSPLGFDEVARRARLSLDRRDDFAEVIVIDDDRMRHLFK